MPTPATVSYASVNSYASGTSIVPLLGETIGANLERTVARFADREALVSCHQGLRFTYQQFDSAVNDVATPWRHDR